MCSPILVKVTDDIDTDEAEEPLRSGRRGQAKR